jgi:flagellar protein FliO/FliZ
MSALSSSIPHVLIGLAALAAVLALILLSGRAASALLARRPQAGRRLALREALALDQRRRLLLVSCDGRDALLLTGGPTDLVVGWLAPGGEVRS